MWLDAEDSRETFSLRCLQLGCSILTRSDDVTRLNHSDWTTAEPEHIDLAFQWLADGFGPGLLVIDSGTSSGSGDNLDQWRAWKPRHLPDSRHQIGVILIEHVVKDNEQRHDQAAGSRGKLADVTGTHVQIDETRRNRLGRRYRRNTTPPRRLRHLLHQEQAPAATAGSEATGSVSSTANPTTTEPSPSPSSPEAAPEASSTP